MSACVCWSLLAHTHSFTYSYACSFACVGACGTALSCAVLSCSQGAQDDPEFGLHHPDPRTAPPPSLLQDLKLNCQLLNAAFRTQLNAATTDEKRAAVAKEYEPLIDKGVYRRKPRACICTPVHLYLHPHLKQNSQTTCNAHVLTRTNALMHTEECTCSHTHTCSHARKGAHMLTDMNAHTCTCCSFACARAGFLSSHTLAPGFHPHFNRPDTDGCTRKCSFRTCRSEADALKPHAGTRSHELLEHMHACTRARPMLPLWCQLGYLHDSAVCLFHTLYTTADVLSNTPLLCSIRAV